MKYQKYLIGLILLAGLISYASADTLVDSYDGTINATVRLYTGNFSHVGQTFANTNSGVLDNVGLYVNRTDAPPGTTTAKIYAHTGTLGAGGVCTGSALATSDEQTAISFNTGLILVTFDFSGANRITLAPATNYCVVIHYENASSDAFLRVNVGYDNSVPTHGGNQVTSLGGSSWTAQTGFDTNFYVYVQDSYIPEDNIPTVDINSLATIDSLIDI